jgi:hypothetical protein
MRNRDIHDPANRVEIAYNDSFAIGRREQARVLRALLNDVLSARRQWLGARRAHKACHAVGN